MMKFQDGIGNPPWDYYFLKNLDESEYPKYLAKLFYLNTGEKLPLKFDFKNKSWIIDKKRCKTFNQKIQWIKLYGVTDLMRKCTDKVLVRDYVAEKIGEDYLKPVMQIIPENNTKKRNVIANHNSILGGEAIQGERSQKAVYENSEIKSNNEPDCHVAIAPRNDGQLNDVFTYFDQIDFDKLPNSFVIKCNHGCKWQFIIKDKGKFLQNKQLFDIVKRKMTGWLEMDYSFWGGFEMQYLTSRRVESPDSTFWVRTRLSEGNVNDRTKSEVNNLPDTKRIIEPIGEINEPVYSSKYGLRKGCQDGIEPKILIEPLLREDFNTITKKIQIYCFSCSSQIIVKIYNEHEITIYDNNCEIIDDIFDFNEQKLNIGADDLINQSIDLSKKLVKNFNFVRVDWMIYKNKLFFEEMTFTPYSGFNKFKNKKNNIKLGKKTNIERF